ncbi:YdcF family protein [Bacillus sp. Marseille-P3661]|uniref:YdcF family protein n=1 Tax=Bacillus sp. Marseille-P3661 TaxID=1936234 RepID=UPI000C82FE96|nr:YdcF family protein [Bacillus sp. Marseille-P3661]
MKKFRLVFAVVVLLILLGFVIKNPLLQALADFLIVKEEVVQSDVIIVLGGEVKGERTKKAVELYHQGYAPMLLFSDGTDLSWRTKAADEMVALALELHVPESAIVKESKSRSTYENALYSKEVMIENGWESAIVVTTDWHTKRSQFIFDEVFKGTDIALTYAGAQDERIDSLTEWWTDSEKQQIVLTEWAKFIVYYLKY